MRKIREVLRLRLGQGLSLARVAQSCGVGKGTVHDIALRARACGLGWPLSEDLDDRELEQRLYRPPRRCLKRAQPDLERVHRELRRKGVTLELLWQEYHEQHPEDGYGYSRFCDLYRQWRGKVDVVMRQQHRGGEKMFVDWAGMKMGVVCRESGEICEVSIFVATLGASSYTYAEAFEHEDCEGWITGHIHSYEFFGGVASVTVPDNPKVAVTRPDYYEPDLNPTYREMSEHYGTAIIPARVRRPKDKAKVENGVQQVERWVLAPLRNQVFFSLGQLNKAIGERLCWLNRRPFSRMEGSRQSLWEQIDRPALQALPLVRFEIPEWKTDVGVSIDYHIEFDHHFYSVPYGLVHKRVDVRAAGPMVEIFYKHRRVASHRRSSVRGRYSTDSAHMPAAHRRYGEWSPGRLIRWAEKVGPNTAWVVADVMNRRPHPEHGFRSGLGIMRLSKQYGAERLERACIRARCIGAPTYRSVKSILKNRLENQPPPTSEPARFSLPVVHENVRGPEYYDKEEPQHDQS